MHLTGSRVTLGKSPCASIHPVLSGYPKQYRESPNDERRGMGSAFDMPALNTRVNISPLGRLAMDYGRQTEFAEDFVTCSNAVSEIILAKKY